MLIFHYLSIGIIALGALITAVGIAYALSYNAATNAPPSSQEDEYERTRMGGTRGGTSGWGSSRQARQPKVGRP